MLLSTPTTSYQHTTRSTQPSIPPG